MSYELIISFFFFLEFKPDGTEPNKTDQKKRADSDHSAELLLAKVNYYLAHVGPRLSYQIIMFNYLTDLRNNDVRFGRLCRHGLVL